MPLDICLNVGIVKVRLYVNHLGIVGVFGDCLQFMFCKWTKVASVILAGAELTVRSQENVTF